MKYNIGDRVRVVGNLTAKNKSVGAHFFQLDEEVVIIQANEFYYSCAGNCREWAVVEDDLELIAPATEEKNDISDSMDEELWEEVRQIVRYWQTKLRVIEKLKNSFTIKRK